MQTATAQKVNAADLFESRMGWLHSRFHFSFAQWYDPDRVHFGVLRVMNDDIVQPRSGFPTHPHRDMEIISYCLHGHLSHKDTTGEEETIHRGDVQYMSAGTGIAHSEMNHSADEDLRFIQIWILPHSQGLAPRYGSRHYTPEDRRNRWLHIVAPEGQADSGDRPIEIYQDANILVSELEPGSNIAYTLGERRQAYLVVLEGEAEVAGEALEERSALKIIGEQTVDVKAMQGAHMLMVEMAEWK